MSLALDPQQYDVPPGLFFTVPNINALNVTRLSIKEQLLTP